jgi:saccharopine dehydrogenase-like NADP-dependent oxidoreductase
MIVMLLVRGIIFKLKQLDAFKENTELLISKLRSLGLFSDRQITPRGNMLDTLCALLEKELAFGPGEVDLVMLQHKFEIENKDGSMVSVMILKATFYRSYHPSFSQKTLTSTLEAYGEVNGTSAMAKTVGVPCGVAVDCILKGKISKAGVHAPYDEEVRYFYFPPIAGILFDLY